MGAFLGDLIPEVAAEVGLPVREGVVIRDVLTNGPADQAGIHRCDGVAPEDALPLRVLGSRSTLKPLPWFRTS